MNGNGTMDRKIRGEETAPPEWLVDYWSAERIYGVYTSELGPQEDDEEAVFSEIGQMLWYLGKNLPMEYEEVPQGLIPGLPLLSFEEECGWVVEFWYYYVNAGLGLDLFPEAKCYSKIRIADGVPIEMKNLTGETEFQQSWTDTWAAWVFKKELRYLARCEAMLKNGPDSEYITAMQAQWLLAHPMPHALWLLGEVGVSEETARYLLRPECDVPKEIRVPLWHQEMDKGVRLGSPELAQRCTQALAEMKTLVISGGKTE